MHFDWFGAFFLGICGLPAAIKAYRTKTAYDISWLFLIFWILGEICMLIDRIPKRDYALLANYFANIVFIAIIIWYKVFPKNDPVQKILNQEKK
jgi:uncharacterized protein with PQ loop repeat